MVLKAYVGPIEACSHHVNQMLELMVALISHFF